MRVFIAILIGLGLAISGSSSGASAKTVRFSGYDFNVRPTGRGAPGPNNWAARNAWVDKRGRLHLKFSKRHGEWYGAEVRTVQRLGFGRYEFWIKAKLSALDPNVVIGLFNYPTPDAGLDETNEIDIEFARWSDPSKPVGNFTVWPVDVALKPTGEAFKMPRRGRKTAHRFDWTSKSIAFRSFRGSVKDETKAIASWTYSPADAASRIARKPMPLYMNIWGFRGRPPSDGESVEIIVRRFSFTPE
jgi:hypothetical protein